MKQNILNNVAIIRPLLILLLVFYHAFAPYSGGWLPIEGFPEIKAYWWLDKLSYFFMLEMFVFISGYLFGFQVRTKGEDKLNPKNLFWSKFKRLMIPGMIFSIFYIFLFRNYGQMSVIEWLNGIVSGTGHMWFLPMLFCCFIFTWIIEKSKVNSKLMLAFLFLLTIAPIKVLPLHMGHAFYYMFFFYVGYSIQRLGFNLDKYYSLDKTIALICLFVVLFPVVTLFHEKEITIGGQFQIAIKILMAALTTLAKTIGIAMILFIVGLKEKNIEDELPQWIIRVGGLCMGVYLFQQFILKELYDNTILPILLGPFWLPWAGFVIALFGSLFLSFILNKTKTGRFLIG